jgi:hypothetical protein
VQIASIDADDLGASGNRSIKFFGVVYLDNWCKTN